MRTRSLLLAAALLLLLRAAPGPLEAVHQLRAATTAVDPVGPVVAAAALSAWALVAWFVWALALTAGSRATGAAGRACARVLEHSAPSALRRAAALALGAGVVLTGAGPAVAAEPGGSPPSPTAASAAARPGTTTPPGATAQSGAAAQPGVTTPPVATGASPASATAVPLPSFDWPGAAPPGAGSGREEVVVVAPGDSLWRLAAAHLPAEATVRQVAQAWPAWWATNREVIGDDPDLLRPGQRLTPPPGTAPPR